MESKGKLPKATEDPQANKRKIIKITVHYSELKSKKLLVQPVVCLHVIDSNNGAYIKKQNKQTAVTSFYENQRDDIDYIMPIMSQPCVIQKKKSQLLTWEESFILNENLEHLLKKEINAILFFEIIDLVPLTFTKYHYERLNENGMQKIAWAFLKILGSNNVTNTGSRLRLQLYKPYSSKKKSTQNEVFQWWLKNPKVALPASLYVSFEEHDVVPVKPALRSMIPLQEEVGSSSGKNSNNVVSDSAPTFSDTKKIISENKNQVLQWSRKEGESCKIPTKHTMSFESIGVCQILKFSSLGKVLVAGCVTSGQYYLLSYDVLTAKLLQKHFAHSDVIYDLDWSPNDDYLLSSSADYSVKLWSTRHWKCLSAFVHPSFVYSAKFQPGRNDILVSACYDHVVRVWAYNKSAVLLQELESHNSAINSLCWNKRLMKLYSADSIGEIKVWKIPKYRTNTSQEFHKYLLDEELSLQDIRGISVHKMIHDSFSDVLFLFCADGTTRIFDINTENFVSRYEHFPKSHHAFIGCCSPCGNLLFFCNNDGSVSIYHREHSYVISTIPNSLHPSYLTYIDYHPYDHALAVCSLDENGRIFYYVHEQHEEHSEQTVAEETNCPIVETAKQVLSTVKNRSLKCTQKEQQIGYQLNKRNSSRNYMCNAETSNDEDFNNFSLSCLKMQSYSSESGSDVHTKSKANAFESRNRNTDSFSAVVTKNSKYEIIAAINSFTESDTQCSGNAISESLKMDMNQQLQRSSKRSQRRKKLKERIQS